ncbi:PadR family transcriptional regulator [Terriglobus aquaticus]|uniref:PadR family transcriptional regulator n=1 Tax=Terriglobus aquaticus TaxID=940139 RepID=A0ABW9KII8_9BACT|nr:PadR family transcriptional regulator [Terriglobus aquaticus]
MSEKDWLGEFEQIVLLAVLRLGANAYGFAIQQEIQARIGRSCSIGAISTTLDRMEQKGFVSSRYGESTPERGGRAKKFFKVEAAGQAGLRNSYAARAAMAHGLEPLFGGA